MHRTFKYPLHPTKAQEEVLEGWLRQCCDLFNAALQERRDAWRKQRRSVSYNAQTAGLAEWRQADPEGAAVPSDVQRSALRRVDDAFKDFFRRVKSKRGGGFPRFRPYQRYDSFEVPAMHVRLEGSRVKLPKLPDVKVNLYRPLQGRMLSATVRREPTGKWFVCFDCDLGAAPEKMDPQSIIGIDLGLKALAVTSDGEVFENPKHAERSAEKLARAQRMLSRRKRGSRGRVRAKAAVARAHVRVKNQRLDHARKLAANLVSRFDVIAYEDLDIRALSRGILAGAIMKAGWGLLLRAIDCKAESAGKWTLKVDPRGTSQRCSGCGATVPKDLDDRLHECPRCGLVIDRDHNAALNICSLGRSEVPWMVLRAYNQAQSG